MSRARLAALAAPSGACHLAQTFARGGHGQAWRRGARAVAQRLCAKEGHAVQREPATHARTGRSVVSGVSAPPQHHCGTGSQP